MNIEENVQMSNLIQFAYISTAKDFISHSVSGDGFSYPCLDGV